MSATMVCKNFRLLAKEVTTDLPFFTAPLNFDVLVDPFEAFLDLTYKLKHIFLVNSTNT